MGHTYATHLGKLVTTEIHFRLCVKDALMHYPETPSNSPQMARSAFRDGFLLTFFNHEDAFLGSEGINRTAWGTKLLNGSLGPPCVLYQFMHVTYLRYSTSV